MKIKGIVNNIDFQLIIELIENRIHDTSRKVISEFWSMAYALFQFVYEV